MNYSLKQTLKSSFKWFFILVGCVALFYGCDYLEELTYPDRNWNLNVHYCNGQSEIISYVCDQYPDIKTIHESVPILYTCYSSRRLNVCSFEVISNEPIKK